MRPAELLRALAFTVVLTLPLAALARAPYTPPGAEGAVLRLAWRSNIQAEQSCRPRTPAELEALPVHMRTPEICTADRASFRLVVRLDDRQADTVPVAPGGAKGDRPVFVLREVTLPPGVHRVRVSFEREANGSAEGHTLRLDTTLVFTAGAIHLVTLDAEARRLVVRSSDRSAPERGGSGALPAPQ
jgi:hypothetical protein